MPLLSNGISGRFTWYRWCSSVRCSKAPGRAARFASATTRERLLSWAWWYPRVVGAFASAEPAINWRWRLDSHAALYQGRHHREALALRATPYGSAYALISSPPTSFASHSRLQAPRGSPGVPRSADDIPATRPRISGRRSRPHLVRIRRDNVRFRATQPGSSMTAT